MTRRNKYSQESKQEKRFFIKEVIPKNYSQEMYMDSLDNSVITFGHGNAGSGKTYLAVAIAIKKLLEKQVDKIIITRPIVSTESLGFLPGDISEKVFPYMLPIFDSFEYIVGPVKFKEMMEGGLIEVRPLAYLRGCTLNNAFVIFDEAQNCTTEQMRMFLSRIGFNTYYAINGDESQSDLDKNIENGLSWAIRKMIGKSKHISLIEFSKSDIVRNPIIVEILSLLDAPEQKEEKSIVKKKIPLIG